MSSKAPNLQNIPAKETPEYRKCIVAGDGNDLVVADWSSQEPRIAAYLSQDEKLIELFKSGKDVYIEIASQIFGETIKKKDPRRKLMKDLFLGLCYGMSAWGLARKVGRSKDEAQALMDQFFGLFPDFKHWTKVQRQKHPYVETPYHRKCWLNPYSEQSERNALNAPMQGGGGDMMKIAITRFCDAWGENIIVAPIHDELLLEVSHERSQEAAKLLEKVMVEVGEETHKGIPAQVEVFIGSDWSVKNDAK